ncbi:MAG: hypothetical protein PHW66_07960 [Gallionella sp.]|jgi:class 3 adenylate cyclase|nr:hypothetical protein [Gallionella sp.]
MDNQTTASAPRSIIATVLFFDVVGYTKQPVDRQTIIKQQFTDQLASCLGGIGVEERIILDTGDGAAIGFLQHPEDAIKVGLCFCTQAQEKYPEMKVRTGIHLGPINVVRDMNGINNMVGDGINDAQRIMSFAGTGEIYVSRPYYDFISRLNAEYESMFVYRGAQKDKHGRAHQVYEVHQPNSNKTTEDSASRAESSGITLEPFSLDIPEPEPMMNVAPVEIPPEPVAREENQLLSDLNAFLTDSPEAESTTERIAPVTPEKPEIARDEKPPVVTQAEPAPASPPKPQARVIKAKQSKKSAGPADQISGRKRGSLWLALIGGGIVLLLALIFALPYVMPWESYARKVEQNLSANLGMPVKVGGMRGHLLPSPQLEFSDISVGAAGTTRIGQARAHLGFNSLFTTTKPVKLLEIQNLQLDASHLQNLAGRLNQLGTNGEFALQTVSLESANLHIPGEKPITDIGGTLNFSPEGKFTRARLEGTGGKYQLDIDAMDNGPLQLVLNVRGAVLPPFGKMTFDGLELHAEAGRDSLLVRKLDGRILGGVLRGNARLSWESGWHAEGLLLAETLTLGQLQTAVEGDMDAEAQFVASASSFSGLAENLLMRGNFQVGKGVLHGLDLVASARQRAAEVPAEARTEFDSMRGEIELVSGQLGLRGVSLQSALLNVMGTADIRDQQLSGTLLVNYNRLSGLRSAQFRLEGSVTEPRLR